MATLEMTPELRQWVVEQARSGQSPAAVVGALQARGWDEELAVDAVRPEEEPVDVQPLERGDRDRPDDTLKDLLNNSSHLVGVLMRGARLTIDEVNRLVDAMRTHDGWVGATMNDVEAVRMVARH